MPRFDLFSLDQTAQDSDHDGLPDVVEFVYGTDPENPDSDGDGIPDGAEVDQGSNPLDGRIAETGVIATISTPGAEIDVRVENDLVLTAEGPSGLSLLSTYNGSNPILLSHIVTGGDVRRVAFASGLAVAAQPDKGIAIIDFSSLSGPQVRNFGMSGAQALASDGSSLYVGTSGGAINIFDPIGGDLLNSFYLTNAIWDLALDHGVLYALTDDRLFAIRIEGLSLAITGSAPSPYPAAGNRRFSAGGGFGYAVHRTGYNVFDLSKPSEPVLITAGTTKQFGWRDLVPNGAGLGIATTGPNSADNDPRNISLYDLTSPTNTDLFITQLLTPGSAEAVVLYNALAYVADRSAGLQVMNYLAFDNKRTPPTISLSPLFETNNAPVGSDVLLVANAQDDVQVRAVELYLDDVNILTDRTFPFEFRFNVPVVTNRTTFRLRARAYDTGGNASWSEEIAVKSVPDTVAPKVIATSPFRGGARVVKSVTAHFDKPINPESLSTASFKVFGAGRDGKMNTADDILLTGTNLTYNAAGRAATLAFQQLPFGKYRAVLTAAVADIYGNHLLADYTWDFEVADASFWIAFGDGNWTDPVNWENGEVPTATNNVIINFPATVYIDSGVTVGKSIRGVPGSRLAIGIAATFDRATLDIDLLLYGSAKVRIVNGLTLNSTATLYGGLNLTQLNFDGTQTFDGTGTVFLTDPNSATIQVQPISGTLTIGYGLTLHGSGTVGREASDLINLGTIVADIAGSRLTVTGTPVKNLGTLASTGGASIIPINLANQGTIRLLNSQIILSSTFRPLDLGTIVGANGTVTITGTLDNRGSAFGISKNLHCELSGGTIQSGTVSVEEGAQLVINSPGGTLDGVTVNGDLHLVGSANLRVLNGLTLNGTATIDGGLNITHFNFDGEQTLAGTGTVLFTDSNSATTVLQPTAGALTIGPQITIRGGGGTVGNATLPLTILGRISAETGGGNIMLSASPLMNSGTLNASSGGKITTRDLLNTGSIAVSGGANIVLDGAWTNRGPVQVTGASLTLAGTFSASSPGTISTGPGAAVYLSGIYDNQGKTLVFDDSKVAWLFSGGTVLGGTIQTSDTIPFQVIGSGTLDAVTLDGKLIVQDSSKLTVRNGLVLNGSAVLSGGINLTIIYFDGTQTLDGAADIAFAGQYPCVLQPRNGTLTLGSNVKIHGGSTGIIGDPNLPLISSATITADATRITIYGKPFSNNGITQELNGGQILINP